MTASADQPGATQRPGPCEPLAMAQAALTALNAAAACWDAKAPRDLHAQDSERFLRLASACAQVAIAERLIALTEAVQDLPADAGALGTAVGKAAAAELTQAAKRLADIQDAAAENLSRLADEAELWRFQEPPATPPPTPRRLSRLDTHGSNTRMMSQAQMDGMYAVLCEADSARDTEALADAAWRLYGEAVAARAEAEQAQAALAQFPAAARATAAAAHQNAGRHGLTPREVLTEHLATAERGAGGEPS